MHAPSPSRPQAAHAPSSQRSPLQRGCLARGVGLRWRQFLLGHRPLHATGPISTTPSTSVRRTLPLGHVFVEASTTKGMMGSGAMLPQFVACQKSGIYPTFDSAARLGQIQLFGGIIPYLILSRLRVTGFDFASGPIPVNIKHCRGAKTFLRRCVRRCGVGTAPHFTL